MLCFKKNHLSSPCSSSFLILSGLSIIVLIDQILKYKIRQFGGFYICNHGISFNITFSSFIFWLIFGLFLMASFFYYNYLKAKGLFSTSLMWIFILILGGALSNGIDRIYFNCIIDYIQIPLTLFPIFNIADIAIFFGSFLLFINTLFKK